jgi:hypothetical protein
MFVAALALSQGAAAQGQPQSGEEAEIVVTGTADLDGQIRQFVGALTKAPVGGQLSRFEWEICPTAIGVSPTQKGTVADRMRRIAKEVGIKVAAAGCSPNVLVVVTDDKKAFINALGKKHPSYFGDMAPAEVRRIAREPGPATAWQLEGPALNADGQPVHTDSDSGFAVNDTSRSPSRISGGTRPHFAAAVVVVERKALDGLTTIQLADYAAMRAFARTDPSRVQEAGASTILTVLEAPMGSPVPLTLTARDLGFLKGLYSSTANLHAGGQRTEIGKQVKQELQRSQPRD